MKVLVIGGTGFIGPPLLRELRRHHHKVAVFHRGGRTAELRPSIQQLGVQHLFGDRRHLSISKDEFRRFEPDVVIDLILSSGGQAEELMRLFRNIAGRIVAISSMDAYRAFGIVHGTEPGPLEPVPLTEESPLRHNREEYSAVVLKALKDVFGWLDNAYDKVAVERVVMSDPELPATVLRLPMVYGPGDRLHRLFPLLKRMDDHRQKIIIPEDLASWHGPRGYVDNVASAIALAATHVRAAGHIYNVAEKPVFSELEWARHVAEQSGWRGEFVVLARELTPSHLRVTANLAQQAIVSSDLIRHELKYREVVPLDEALRRTIEWERDNPPPHINPNQFDYAAEDAVLAA